MADLLRPVLDQIAKLWARLDLMPVVRWGTVTQTSPLRVILDGDAEPLPFAPATVTRNLATGDRVVCVEQHRRVIVIAATSGNRAAPYAMAAGNTLVAGWTTVTLPAGRFTQPPRLTLQISDGSSVAVGISPMLNHNNRTTTSFQSRTSSGVGCDIDWHAIQMTAGSASG